MKSPNVQQTEFAGTTRLPRLKVATRFAGLTPRADVSRHVIVFTHVPKTGGTTLDHIFGTVAAVTGKKWRRLSMKSVADRPWHERNQRILNFETLPRIELAADYLTGHFQFGIHRGLGRAALYVTLLRNPVTRLLSNVRFGIDNKKWSHESSIDAIFESKRLVDNIQTRQLAGIADRDIPCTDKTLAVAGENLRQHYAVVGVTERFDETLRALITLLGWPDIAYTDRQVSRSRIDPELEAKATAAVQRHFAFDLELYAEVAARPTPWAPNIMAGSVTGQARQDAILVTSPAIRRDNHPYSLVSAAEFDTQLGPAITRAGGEVVFV